MPAMREYSTTLCLPAHELVDLALTKSASIPTRFVSRIPARQIQAAYPRAFIRSSYTPGARLVAISRFALPLRSETT